VTLPSVVDHGPEVALAELPRLAERVTIRGPIA
jgi:hypothetical protein